jgi:hypothetical protein
VGITNDPLREVEILHSHVTSGRQYDCQIDHKTLNEELIVFGCHSGALFAQHNPVVYHKPDIDYWNHRTKKDIIVELQSARIL